ncbi:hypothetical protein [Pseudophaeobacter sp.]|uniref:hypothetical protein n=1 Tax=Pseudophaeobacter sp. TaxID=1971739 RepID=UPI003297C576
MLLHRTTVSIWALMAATPLMAQVVELQEINVSGETEEACFGKGVSRDPRTVFKTGTTIQEMLRSVNMVTALQVFILGSTPRLMETSKAQGRASKVAANAREI